MVNRIERVREVNIRYDQALLSPSRVLSIPEEGLSLTCRAAARSKAFLAVIQKTESFRNSA
jgi:hypothetical protein